MPTPFASGDASIANRWLYGSATVLWIGDSIGVNFEQNLLRVLRVTPAGIGMAGANLGNVSPPSWTSGGPGGLGATGLLAEKNYSPLATRETVFNGNSIAADGLPAAVSLRIASCASHPFLIASRNTQVFSRTDWFADGSPKLRVVMYRNEQSCDALVRNYIRGSSNAFIEKGTGQFLHLTSPTGPAYVADDINFSLPASNEDIGIEAQSFAGATASNGNNFVVCAAVITNGKPGFTVIPASVGGWDITKWTNTSVISDSALVGVLPLLNITDVVISLGQNNPANQTAEQFYTSLLQVVARIRAALPSASIVFLPTYDTNSSGSPSYQSSFADAHFAAQQATANSCFLNMFAAAGPWSSLQSSGMLADNVHPSASGSGYFIQTLQSLLELLLIGNRNSAVGRYAQFTDIQDIFGKANVQAWCQVDSSGTVDNPRVQRALNFADAFIDDYFRGSAIAVPLQSQASGPVIATWAATLAGVRLYRSRAAASVISGASSTPAVATLNITSAAVSASVTQTLDPYASFVADVLDQMARCKAGTFKVSLSNITPQTNAPSLPGV